MWHWHCCVDVPSCGWVTGLVCSRHCAARSTQSGRVHSLCEGWLCSSSQITLVVLGRKDVLFDFFAVYVGQIQNWCIFIARHYASAVYTIVVCPSEWCGCRVLAAEWLDSSAVGIVNSSSAKSRWVHSLLWKMAMWLFRNDFGQDLLFCVSGSVWSNKLTSNTMFCSGSVDFSNVLDSHSDFGAIYMCICVLLVCLLSLWFLRATA